jgi:hypothetical protein
VRVCAGADLRSRTRGHRTPGPKPFSSIECMYLECVTPQLKLKNCVWSLGGHRVVHALGPPQRMCYRL